jgi:hypothetical protein
MIHLFIDKFVNDSFDNGSLLMIQQDKVLPSSAYKPPGKLLPFRASCFGSFKNEEKE